MKTNIRIISLFLITVMFAFLGSCEREPIEEVATGKLELSISIPASQLKSALPDSSGLVSYHVLISVINSLGEIVIDQELIPLYRFGNQFISEKIEIKTGHYHLSEFLVINPNGVVEFAAPKEGSPKAYLTKDPLPVAFSILPGQNTRLVPEVLPALNVDPSDFGYATFGIHVIRPLPVYVMAVLEDSLLMAPIVPIEAILRVHSPDGWMHDFKLEPRVNRIVIRGGAPFYVFVVSAHGYPPRKIEIPIHRLMETGPENPLIIRISRLHNHVLELQPGPDDGMDAMITEMFPDSNFAPYPYFECTYKSHPILTVMQETRSLIHFNPVGLPKSARIEKVMLTLYYDLPVPWDSLIYDSIYYDSIYYLGNPSTNSFAWFGAALQQVVEPWKEEEVTWNKQPATIEANQVLMTPFIRNANFINVNVTSLFVPVQEIAAPNYGMMLRLWPTGQFPGFRFTSSDYHLPEMRPKLRIYYSLPTI